MCLGPTRDFPPWRHTGAPLPAADPLSMATDLPVRPAPYQTVLSLGAIFPATRAQTAATPRTRTAHHPTGTWSARQTHYLVGLPREKQEAVHLVFNWSRDIHRAEFILQFRCALKLHVVGDGGITFPPFDHGKQGCSENILCMYVLNAFVRKSWFH